MLGSFAFATVPNTRRRPSPVAGAENSIPGTDFLIAACAAASVRPVSLIDCGGAVTAGSGAAASCPYAAPPQHNAAAAIARHGLAGETVRYDAAFGRPLDYYTGLVFEIAAAAQGGPAERPLAGGGRYDRLLTLLGAKSPIPGVGFSVWLDRVEALREGAR